MVNEEIIEKIDKLMKSGNNELAVQLAISMGMIPEEIAKYCIEFSWLKKNNNKDAYRFELCKYYVVYGYTYLTPIHGVVQDTLFTDKLPVHNFTFKYHNSNQYKCIRRTSFNKYQILNQENKCNEQEILDLIEDYKLQAVIEMIKYYLMSIGVNIICNE